MPTKKFILILIFLCLAAGCLMLRKMTSSDGTILNIEAKTDSEQATELCAKILQSRLSAVGVPADVSKISLNRIEIKIYGEQNIESLKNFLLASGKFELKKVYGASFRTFPTSEAAAQSFGGKVPENLQVLPYADRSSEERKSWVIVENPAIISGGDLRTASPSSDSSGTYRINFQLNPAGAVKFSEWTAKNIGSYLAIILNDEIKSAPVIKGPISDSGQIEGRFTKQSAEDLALVMKSGAMPAALQLIDEKKFGN